MYPPSFFHPYVLTFFFLDLSSYHHEENTKERNCVNVRGFSEQLLRYDIRSQHHFVDTLQIVILNVRILLDLCEQ